MTKKVYISIFILFVSLRSLGASISCKLKDAVKCLCPASLTVDCGKGFTGFIANDEKPQSIVVSVYDKEKGTTKEVTLENPPEGIRSYYAGIDSDAWITRQLGDKGITITSNTQLNVTSAKFPESLTLYEDHSKIGPKNKNQVVAPSKFKYLCYYTKEPSLIKDDSCHNSVCSGSVNCWEQDKSIGETTVACKPVGNACPSASACADDNDVKVNKSPNHATETFETDLRQREIQTQ